MLFGFCTYGSGSIRWAPRSLHEKGNFWGLWNFQKYIKLWYGDSVDNSVEENSSIFSPVRMCWLPSARACADAGSKTASDKMQADLYKGHRMMVVVVICQRYIKHKMCLCWSKPWAMQKWLNWHVSGNCVLDGGTHRRHLVNTMDQSLWQWWCGLKLPFL